GVSRGALFMPYPGEGGPRPREGVRGISPRRQPHASARTSAARRAPQDAPVGDDVHGGEERREQPLDVRREADGVEHRAEIVREEAPGIAGLTTEPAPVILERGERADAARELDPGTPDERGRMQEHHPAPAPGEKAPE